MQDGLPWQKVSAVFFEIERVRPDTAAACVRAYQDQKDAKFWDLCDFLAVSTCNQPENLGVALPVPLNAITRKLR